MKICVYNKKFVFDFDLAIFCFLTFFVFAVLGVPFADLVKMLVQDEVIATITVENGPRGVVFNADNGHMYVINQFWVS